MRDAICVVPGCDSAQWRVVLVGRVEVGCLACLVFSQGRAARVRVVGMGDRSLLESLAARMVEDDWGSLGSQLSSGKPFTLLVRGNDGTPSTGNHTAVVSASSGSGAASSDPLAQVGFVGCCAIDALHGMGKLVGMWQ